MEVRPGNPRYPYKPPVPLTVIVNPVIEPLDDEVVQINEGCLSVPNLRGEVPRHVNIRRALPRPRRRRARRGQARPDRRHVPARARPPRRRAVRRPRHATRARSPPGRSSSASTATSSWSGARARRAGRLVTTLLVRARPGSAGRRARAGVVVEVEDGRITRSASGAPAPPPRRTAPRRAHAARASPTRTRTPSSAPCAGAPSTAAARSGPGASRCTRLAERLDPESYLALARATYAEMALAGITTRRRVPLPAPRAGRRAATTTRTRWARCSSPPPPRPAIRITLLDACYLHGGIGAHAGGRAAAFLGRQRGGVGRARRRLSTTTDVGAHRRRDPQHARGRPRRRRRPWRRGPPSADGPLHAHVSEQPAENEACLGRLRAHPHRRCSTTPARSAASFTAVHATHLDDGRRAPARRRGLVLLRVPDDRARPGRRDRPDAPRSRTPARRCRSAPTRTP